MSSQQTVKPNRLPQSDINDNFTDISPPLSQKQVLVASERCLFCYDAPCIKACPTEIDIPLFIRKINTGNVHGAAKEILSANILGGSCARVCPTETLCEQACVRNTCEAEPVNISGLQRFAVDNLDPAMGYPFVRAADTGRCVAVVGAGPASLACAHRLARNGHRVIIYEAASKSGGLNEYGIAKYKLVDNYAQQEVDFVLKIGGITIKYNMALGNHITLSELRSKHDAVFIGIGMGQTNQLNVAGEDLPSVEDSVHYIGQLRQSEKLADLPVARRIVVIGGGMTAIDIAVQSKKLGAEQVTLVYRRSRSAMGASAHEQALALSQGIKFMFNLTPSAIIGDQQGISAVEFRPTCLDKQSKLIASDGEKELNNDQSLRLTCDIVFKAIGQHLDSSLFIGRESVRLDKYGRIAVNEKFQTSLSRVFAGGDCIKGKDLVVEAVHHGDSAALAINELLQSGRATG
jgi:dihydropyrimidine dehydrogenase (NAD+) subunit PreT